MYVERLGMLFAVPCSWLNTVSFVREHKSLGGDIVWTQTALLKYKLTLNKYVSDHQSLRLDTAVKSCGCQVSVSPL